MGGYRQWLGSFAVAPGGGGTSGPRVDGSSIGRAALLRGIGIVPVALHCSSLGFPKADLILPGVLR